MGMLDNKVAFITGAASGIGAGTARRFADEGAHIILADVQDEEGQKLQREIESSGRQALYVLLRCQSAGICAGGYCSRRGEVWAP